MFSGWDDVIEFWFFLRASQSVPKELLLQIAEAQDSKTFELLIWLDIEASKAEAVRRERENGRRGNP